MKSGRGRAWAATVLLGALVAGGCADRAGDPGAESRTALRCDGPELERSSALPLDSVAIHGAEAGDDPVYALVRAPGVEGEGIVRVEERPGGRLLLRVPAHPTAKLEGGPIELSLVDGTTRCPPLRMTVEALPPAPGATEATVAGVEAYLEAMAAHFGTTPEDLAEADPDTLPPPLIPLLIARGILDHPENPRSVRRLLEAGSRPRGGAGSPLLDALLARAGVPGHLESSSRDTRELLERTRDAGRLWRRPAATGRGAGRSSARHAPAPAPHPGEGQRRPVRGRTTSAHFALARSPAGGGSARAPRRSPARPTLHLRAPSQASGSSSGGTEKDPGVDVCASVENPRPSAEQLDAWMRLARSSEIATTGAPARTLKAFNLALGAGTALATVAGKSGAPGGEKLAKLYAGTAGLAFAYQKTAEAAAHLLPSELVEIDFEVGKPIFREDDEGRGRWEGPWVVARSKGWSFEKLALEALAQVAGMGAAGGLDDVVIKYMPGRELGELLEGLAQFTVMNTVNDIIGEATEGSGLLRCPPMDFGPTRLRDKKWYTAHYTGRAVQPVLFPAGGRFYEPKDVGRSLLRVATAPGKFGHREPVSESKPIRVRPIRVVWEPARTHTDPGDEVRFMVAVEDAVDKDLDFDVDAGRIAEKRHYGDSDAGDVGYWRVVYQAPSDERDFPVTLQATSTADRSHLRTVKERTGEARVDTDRLEVTPAGRCVKPRDEIRFTALLNGEPTPGVRWRARRGRIRGDGEYRAPRRAGEDTVTATLRRDSEVEARAVVAVRGCSWTLQVRGGPRAGFYWGRHASLRRSGGDARGSGFVLLTQREAAVFGLTNPIRISLALDEVPRGAVGTFASGARNQTTVIFNDRASSSRGDEVMAGMLEAAGPLASEPHAAYWTETPVGEGMAVETADGPLPLDRIHTLRGSFPIPDPATLEITANEENRIAGRVKGEFLTLTAGHRAGPMAGDSAAFETIPIELEFDAKIGENERRLRRVKENLFGRDDGNGDDEGG